jgi:hypothetical protein
LVVLHVTDRRRVVLVGVGAHLHEGGLVEADGRGLVESFAIGLEQGGTLGGDGVVHGVPVTGELVGDLFDRPAGADLEGRPLGGASREQAVLRRDSVVLQHPDLSVTGLVHALHAVLLPGEAHRGRVDAQVDVAHDRAFFHLGHLVTRRATNLPGDLFDHQFDFVSASLVIQDPDVLQAHQGFEDLDRVADDKGASS